MLYCTLSVFACWRWQSQYMHFSKVVTTLVETLLHAGITLVLMPWVPLPRRWPLQAGHAMPYHTIPWVPLQAGGRGRRGPTKEGGKTTQAGLCTHPSSIRHPTVIHCNALTQKHFITSGLGPMLHYQLRQELLQWWGAIMHRTTFWIFTQSIDEYWCYKCHSN